VLQNRISLNIHSTGGDEDMMALLDRFHTIYTRYMTSVEIFPLTPAPEDHGRSVFFFWGVHEGPRDSMAHGSLQYIDEANRITVTKTFHPAR
jgi:hypothetical protein